MDAIGWLTLLVTALIVAPALASADLTSATVLGVETVSQQQSAVSASNVYDEADDDPLQRSALVQLYESTAGNSKWQVPDFQGLTAPWLVGSYCR